MVQHKAQDVAARPRTEDIHISEDIDFKSMLLPKPILQGLKKAGYVKPSPIQRKAIPLVRCGLDLIVQAKAGTGKTCVFTIAALEIVQPSLPHLQAVILAPTREIALQITEVINAIGQAIRGLKTCCFIGGYPISLDERNAKGCQIAVGAPGRVKHLMGKGLLQTQHVRLFVLDEADKLMEKTFVDDINVIFSYLPQSKQVLACSATYTSELVGFLSNYMHHGQYVSPQQGANPPILLGIRQYVSVLPHHVDKLAKLRLKERQLLYLLRSVSFNQCLVFSNLHTRAMSVCNLLRGKGWSVEWIAGRQDQGDRVLALSQLKEQRVRVLVTTDLTARGIDAENVNLIINLDVPFEHQTYLHRMGRAGRYGSHGMVITILFAGEELALFQKLLGAIGGTSQSVNCVPEDLKNVDLWRTEDKDLEQVYGTLNNLEKAESSAERSEESTSTDEKFSQESSDELEESVANERNGENTSVRETCDCNLYEPELSDIVVVSGPSLFSVSKKEETWREVLPVVVNEFKILLNTPLVLFDSKLIRVKFLDNKEETSVNYLNTDMTRNHVIDFETNHDDRDFLCFEEIETAIESGISLKIDLKSNACENSEVLSFEEMGQLLESGIADVKLKSCDYYETSLKLSESEKVLKKYQDRRDKFETILARFDSFDLVGWMAVDETHNIVEELLTDTCDVFEFNLVKCPTGSNHIEILSSVEDSLKENNDCDDHISTFNLEKLHITSPISLRSIAEKLKCNINKPSIRPNRKQSKNEGVVKAKYKTEEQVKPNISKESLEEKSNSVIKEKQPTKQYNQKTCHDYKTAKKENTFKNPKKILKDKAPDVSSNSKSHVENKERESKEKYPNASPNGYKEPVPVYAQTPLPEPFSQNEVVTATTEKTARTSCTNKPLTKSLNNHKEQIITIPVRTFSELTNPVSQNLGIFSKQKDTLIESKSESDKNELNLSEKPFNPCSVSNGHHRSSENSEDSGPYVDMSQNLAKWQELHDVEESDSVSSSESDAIQLSGPIRVRESYSDSTNCSYKTSQAIKHKDFHCRLMKHAKNQKKRHQENSKKSERSYDSVESETTNRNSFQSACSRHLASEEDFRDYSPHGFSHLNYCNEKSSLQSHTYFHNIRTKTPKNLYKYLEKNSQEEETCHQRRKLADQVPSSRRPPQNDPCCSASQFHGPFNQYDPYNGAAEEPGQFSNTTQTLRSDNLFSDWYSTWYTQVRQRAKELEMTEYINVMSTP